MLSTTNATTTTVTAGSLILTTLLTNCHILPATQAPVALGSPGSGSPRARLSSVPVGSDAESSGDGRGAGGGRQGDQGTAYHFKDFRDPRVKAGGASGPGGYGSGSGQGYRKGGGKYEASTNTTRTDSESDPGAVMYIIVVLVFYSTGVMVMIVRYLRTEKKELEEEVTLENFFKSMPDKQQEKEHRVNRVAIRAFHTLTSISYDDEELEGMDLGDSDTETAGSRGDLNSSDAATATSSQPLLVTDL